MNDPIAHALEAFESALRHAPLGGLRDLHEALQTGQLATPYDGKADLVRGRWGTLGGCVTAERYSACPLNALYVRWAREHDGQLRHAIMAMVCAMAQDGYQPSNFYAAWDAGQLDVSDLIGRVEHHIEARLDAAQAAR